MPVPVWFVPTVPVVVNCAEITAGIDLALYLIEPHAGAPMAAEFARRQLIYQRHAGKDSQRSPWLAHRNHRHPAVHRAQDLIARNPTRGWAMAELAQAAHVRARHLSRLFAEMPASRRTAGKNFNWRERSGC